nr:glycosyltransferase family 39 protein [Herpetosiphonaceae bacterium]
MHGQYSRKLDRRLQLGKTRSTLAHMIPQHWPAFRQHSLTRFLPSSLHRPGRAGQWQPTQIANVSPFRTQVMPTVRLPWLWLGQAGAVDQRVVARRILLSGLILVGLVAHALNMFHYPDQQWIAGEGTYVARAWALLHAAHLTSADFFAQPPAGWLLLAGWGGVTGGPHTFGTAIESARVFMLLLHLGMLPLLFRIARKLGCGDSAAAFVVLLFSLSPLAILYQRFVLPESIMVWWTLVSINVLLDGWHRLSRLMLSGLCFGVALLTHESTMLLLPGLLVLLWQQHRSRRALYTLAAWFLPLVLVVSLYPLLALLHGDGTLLQGEFRTVLPFQPVSSLWNAGAPFWQLVRTDWFPRDPLLLLGGLAATLVNLGRGLRDRRAGVFGLLGLLSLAYLVYAGNVVDVAVLLALPFLCLNLGLLVAPLLNRLSVLNLPHRRMPLLYLLAPLMTLALIAGYAGRGKLQSLYAINPEPTERAATLWIKQHLPADSVIIASDSTWTDLRAPGLGGGAFSNVRRNMQATADAMTDNAALVGEAVDYLLLPDQPTADNTTSTPLVHPALAGAHIVRQWATGGEGLTLWKVDQAGPTDEPWLAVSTTYLRQHFDHDGAYVEPSGPVMAEAQANALLRAVWSDDRAGFEEVWSWSQKHMLRSDGLLQATWSPSARGNARTAADADSDTALALLLADKRWHEAGWDAAARHMLGSIWDQEVVTVDGKPYLVAGNWARDGQLLPLNPSYFAPYAYRIFGEVDQAHPWQQLVDSSYAVLQQVAQAPLDGKAGIGLPPEWIGLDRATGQLVPLQVSGLGENSCTTCYSDDAPRSYWRVALDLRWSDDQRA